MPAPIALGLGIVLKLLDIGLQQQAFSAEYQPQARTFAGKIREALQKNEPLDPIYITEQEAALTAELSALHARADEAREKIKRREGHDLSSDPLSE